MLKPLKNFINKTVQIFKDEFSFLKYKEKFKSILTIYYIEIGLLIFYFLIPYVNKDYPIYKNSFQVSQSFYIPIILIILVFIEIYFRIKEKTEYLGIFPLKFLGILFIASHYFSSVFLLPNNIHYIFLHLLFSTFSGTIILLFIISLFFIYFYKKFTTISFLKNIIFLSVILFLLVGIVVQVFHTNRLSVSYTYIHLDIERVNSNKEEYCKIGNTNSLDTFIVSLYYSQFEIDYYSKRVLHTDLIYDEQKEKYINNKIAPILNLNCETKIALINQQQKINESIIQSHSDHFSNFLNVLIIPNIFVIFNFLNNKRNKPTSNGSI